ncbi:hypothetical protein KPL71_023900 [Citrus sinensis]|uniref:Uncharacterized protein n=1 Tax=Citrus sinensis TaxID=2711 RepID=A0ACB8IMH8_CITSI|nr:hypothetical protein KPL71_023900 [Citrus sinensis]
MHQYSAQIIPDPSDTDQTSDSNLAVSVNQSESDTDSSLESSISSSDSEKSYADITRILMAQPEETEPAQSSRTDPFFEIPSDIEEDPPEASLAPTRPAQSHHDHKPSNGPWFTFDDIPAAKWRDRLSEMAAWTDLQMLRANATTASILRELATRFTGSLRDWFEETAVFEAARRDYLNMKCCSLNSKDLDFHYKRMSILFYKLNGFNNPTLKHVFLALLPEELQPDIPRQLTSLNLTIDTISLGKIFQIAKGCLEKLCEQKQFFKELLKDKEPFRSACKKPYLQIKCQKKKDCDCNTKKKKCFRKFKNPALFPRSKSRRKSYRIFRKRSSSFREQQRKKSRRCFIYKKKGHYAKDCPNKKDKAIRLLEHLQATTDYSPHNDEIESYFSEQEEPTDETVFALQNSSDKYEHDEFQTVFHQQLLSLDTTIPIPSIKLHILPSKFQRSILLDTGAQRNLHNNFLESQFTPLLGCTLVFQIQERLRTAQSRQESYADRRRRDLELQVEDYVFLRVSPWKGVLYFKKRVGSVWAWVGGGWFDSLGQYRQLQFVQLPEVSSALAVIHDQFLGDPSAVFEAARRDYLNMKCCSLNAKDLDFHYKCMSLLLYKLNGFNEPTLKHVFLASLPEELQPDIQRQLTASNLILDNISLGKIFQIAKTCLDKLCEQKQSRKPYRFFKKKSSSSREFKRKKSSRCFICKKKGHYAKDCPNKREKSIRLVEHLQATTDYSPEKDELEFYFSEQDEPNDETVFALQNSSDESDSDVSQVIFHQQLLSLATTVPIPSIKLHILLSKFQRPIPAIGLIDTGAQRSMLNPNILPPDSWTKYEENFRAVNGKLFTTTLITKKPIGIQIFPHCVIWTKVIGSTLPNKDILLGFDILHQIKHLQIIPTGIRVKSMFKPFTDLLKLYNLSDTPQSYQDISSKLLRFCPESHSEFTHPNPLWKNPSFFIKLPFKLNEDINPTKATYPGMSPSDLLLAQKECSQLLAQGSHDEHRQLLTQFYDIVQSHGIMLSAKKSTIATDNIEFLGMLIRDGHYQPGKHIAQELLHFSDQHLSKKQVQQFLGIINYIRDFIPHVDRYTHHLSALLKNKPP